MIEIYKKYGALRDRFEVLAIHNSDAASLAEMDLRLPGIRKRYWGGKALPFPVLLDDESLTWSEYKASKIPTYILLDPTGKVVERGGPERLAEELARLTPPEEETGGDE